MTASRHETFAPAMQEAEAVHETLLASAETMQAAGGLSLRAMSFVIDRLPESAAGIASEGLGILSGAGSTVASAESGLNAPDILDAGAYGVDVQNGLVFAGMGLVAKGAHMLYKGAYRYPKERWTTVGKKEAANRATDPKQTPPGRRARTDHSTLIVNGQAQSLDHVEFHDPTRPGNPPIPKSGGIQYYHTDESLETVEVGPMKRRRPQADGTPMPATRDKWIAGKEEDKHGNHIGPVSINTLGPNRQAHSVHKSDGSPVGTKVHVDENDGRRARTRDTTKNSLLKRGTGRLLLDPRGNANWGASIRGHKRKANDLNKEQEHRVDPKRI